MVIFKTIQTVEDFGYITFIQEASSAILEKHLDKLSYIRLELVVILYVILTIISLECPIELRLNVEVILLFYLADMFCYLLIGGVKLLSQI